MNISECKEKRTIKLFALITAIIICIFSMLFIPDRFDNSSAAEKTTPTAETAAITAATNQNVPAQGIPTIHEEPSESTTAATAAAFSYQPDNISAPYAGLYNASTGEALFEKNTKEKIHPASLTKILTAVTALTYISSDTVFTVSSEQDLVPERSSLCLIKKGHKITLYDLLTGMLVSSGNDAAYTIAVNVARLVMDRESARDSEALRFFVSLMNTAALQAGAVDSHFVNPDGFDNDEQYTTVSDLAAICRFALGFEEIREIVKLHQKRVVFASGQNVTWANSNLLLQSDSPYYFPKATGMKTGTTPLAGRCLIATADINESAYIAIVVGCETDDSRYKSVINLFDSVPHI